MYFKTADVAGLRIFYREAGDPSKPTIVLLHGFPSSSYEFHDLIPRLADRFHVIAPDYPGMGFSDAPAPTVLRPTFDDVAMVIDAFIAQRAPGPVILYMHDFGGPIGMPGQPGSYQLARWVSTEKRASSDYCIAGEKPT